MSATDLNRPAWHAISGLLALLFCACGSGNAGDDGAVSRDAAPVPSLRLLREKKLSKLISVTADHLEASGVVAKDGQLYVVFDNMTSLAKIAPDLTTATVTPGLIEPSAFEAITVDPQGGRFYVMKESESSILPRAQVVLLDDQGAYQGAEATDVRFQDINKGFEGIAWLTVGGTERLVALCEGNFCTGDTSTTGHGQVMVLAHQDTSWVTEATIELPHEANFADYSDIALHDNGDGTFRIAVVSQASSAVWLGTLGTSPWAVSGPGVLYRFPPNIAGEVMYCTVEGVTFLSATDLAFVSDKSDGTVPCNNKDESVHVFAVP